MSTKNVVIDGITYVPVDQKYKDFRTELEEAKCEIESIRATLITHMRNVREQIQNCKNDDFTQHAILNEYHAVQLEILFEDLSYISGLKLDVKDVNS